MYDIDIYVNNKYKCVYIKNKYIFVYCANIYVYMYSFSSVSFLCLSDTVHQRAQMCSCTPQRNGCCRKKQSYTFSTKTQSCALQASRVLACST